MTIRHPVGHMMMNKKRPRCLNPSSNRFAFTLVELLVVLSVIAILSGLGLQAFKTARGQGDRVVALSNLRQIGTAILAHANDHQGVLPGPLWPGQIPVFDKTRSGRLPVELSSYLSIDPNSEKFTVPLFLPPAYRRNMKPGAKMEDARTLVTNMKVLAGNELINPWGSLAGGSAIPLPLSRIEQPATTWALSDADQQHPHVKTAAWRTNTPEKTIHGDLRLTLFFDGHAAAKNRDQFEIPSVVP